EGKVSRKSVRSVHFVQEAVPARAQEAGGVEGDSDCRRLALNVAARDEAEDARVQAVVAVVAHHEEVFLGDVHQPEETRSLLAGGDHYRMRFLLNLFAGKAMLRALARVDLVDDFPVERAVVCPTAVHPQLIVDELNRVAWNADDAFDQARAIGGGAKDDDLAARGRAPADEAPADRRDLQGVGEVFDARAV